MDRSSSSSSSSSSSYDSDSEQIERPVDILLSRVSELIEKIDHSCELLDNNPAVLTALPELLRLFEEGRLLIQTYYNKQNAVQTKGGCLDKDLKPGPLVRCFSTIAAAKGGSKTDSDKNVQ